MVDGRGGSECKTAAVVWLNDGEMVRRAFEPASAEGNLMARSVR